MTRPLRIHTFWSLFVLCCVALSLQAQNGHAAPVGSSNDEQYQYYFHLADEHLGRFEFQQSLDDCKRALQYRPDDFLVRAMICLDEFEIGEALDIKVAGNEEKKLRLYEMMKQTAEEGIRLAPDNGECYFMRGLANARIATTKGVLSQLFTAKQIEQDWLFAVDKKSDYTTPNGENLQASSCIALGVYYRLAPRFFLIRWLFGISGDLDKAVLYCRRAYELDPTRIEIVKEYGIALITRGLDLSDNAEIERGKEFLRKVPALPLRLHTDPIDIAHSRMLLNDISLCPGYSRDEQQDVSEEAVKKVEKK